MDTTEDRPYVIVPEPVVYICEACEQEFEASPMQAEEPFVICGDCAVPR